MGLQFWAALQVKNTWTVLKKGRKQWNETVKIEGGKIKVKSHPILTLYVVWDQNLDYFHERWKLSGKSTTLTVLFVLLNSY